MSQRERISDPSGRGKKLIMSVACSFSSSVSASASLPAAWCAASSAPLSKSQSLMQDPQYVSGLACHFLVSCPGTGVLPVYLPK